MIKHLLSTTLLVATVAIVSFLYFQTSKNVPYNYMVNSKITYHLKDEIFHIRQTQRYCNHQFTKWDDKITTLPGLYFIGFVHAKFLSFFTDEFCSRNSLRLLNVFFSFASFFLLKKIFKLKFRNDNITLLKSLNLFFFPLHFFFMFLFYTDVGSIFFLLLGYYFTKKKFFVLGSFSCTVSILFRQTNIIWTFWIAAESLLEENENLTKEELISTSNIIKTIRNYFTFLTIGISFLLFVYWNKGIVVGDRSNHIAILHGNQVFYFSVFCCFFTPLHSLLFLIKKNFWNLKIFFIFLPVVAYIVYKFNYIHTFMLSDNRHYIFYLWRKLFRIHVHEQSKLIYSLYSPIFLISILVMLKSLKKSWLWKGLFSFCICANLIPLPLVEFRYFLIPFFLYYIHLDQEVEKEKTVLIKEISNLTFYLLINGATMYLFLYRPFLLDKQEARFMW